ncbi:MAG TPA: ribose-phosphate diphosphokinase [Kangiella sp.]
MSTLLFDLSENLNLSAPVCDKIGATMGKLSMHCFPDGEVNVQLLTPCKEQTVVVLADLSHPNSKILPLLFVLRMIKEQSPKKIVLIAPYLPYMRQDAVFHEGESILAKHFAEILSENLDALITVDPHLHRFFSLDQVYPIRTYLAHTSSPIAQWIKSQVKEPVIVGPDSESRQWVEAIASEIHVPFLVANKVRHGDKNVEITVKGLEEYKDKTVVLVDDIISTGHTILEITRHLEEAGVRTIICVATHAIFNENAYGKLAHSHISQIVSCNTIPHVSNAIDVSDSIAESFKLVK